MRPLKPVDCEIPNKPDVRNEPVSELIEVPKKLETGNTGSKDATKFTTNTVLLTIDSAKFDKDFDSFGKMDPFIQFKYGPNTKAPPIMTKIMEGAGQNAVFNFKHTLTNVD